MELFSVWPQEEAFWLWSAASSCGIGLAKVVKDDALLAKVRDIMPQIMDMYDKNGWEMGLFYLENGHAEIRGMLDLKEEFDV